MEPVNVTKNLSVRQSIAIGLGGMGSFTLGHLKEKLCQYFDLKNFDGVNFLAIDTAKPDANVCREVEVVTEFLQLESPSNFYDIIDHPEKYPDIMGELPDKLDYSLFKEAESSEEGAGTWRSFSQIIFRSGNNYKKIYEKIEQLFSSTQKQQDKNGKIVQFSNVPLNIFIIGSIFGGTGSGIFIDIAAIARQIAKRKNAPARIIGIFFLPGFTQTKDYRHNAAAYASLKEIEYFLSENPYHTRFIDKSEIKITNSTGNDKILNTVFLIDQPVHNREEMSRCLMADVAGELIFHLTATEIGHEFFNRYRDHLLNKIFKKPYPILTEEEIRKNIKRETRRTFYSTCSIKTFVLPQKLLKEYVLNKYASDVFKELYLKEKGIEDTIEIERLVSGGPGISGIINDLDLDRESLLSNFKKVNTNIFNIRGTREPINNMLAGISDITNLRSQWKNIFDKELEVLKIRYLESKTAKGEIEQTILQIIGSYGYSVADYVCGRLIEYIRQETEKFSKEFEKVAKNHDEKMLVAFIEEARQNLDRIRTVLGQIAQGGRVQQLFTSFINKYMKRSTIPKQILMQLEAQCNRNNKFITEEAHFLAITNILNLFEEFIKEIKRIREEIIKNIDKRMSIINEMLLMEINKSLQKEIKTYATENISISGLYERFYKKFLDSIPEKLKPEKMAMIVKKEGIPIKGIKIKLDQFEKYSNTEIIDSFRNLSDKINKDFKDDLDKIWDINFNDNFFSDKQPPPNDFTDIANQFDLTAKPYLNYDRSDINPEEFSYINCGVMVDKKIERNWHKILKNKFTALELTEGRYSNQVSLLGFTLGIPSIKLNDIEKWYSDYLHCIYNSLPIHTKRGIVYMSEPYIDINYKPDEFVDQFFKVLCYEEIVEKNEDGEFRYNLASIELRPEFKNIFFDERKKEELYISENNFKDVLKKNYILNNELRNRLVNQLNDKCIHKDLNLDEYRNSFIEKEVDETEKENWIDFFNGLDKEINKVLSILRRA